MIDRKYYNIVLKALQLACEELNKSNIEVTKDNLEMIEYRMYGSLVGYYLIKAQELLDVKIV